MKERDFLTVSELNAYLNSILENDHLLWNIIIKGEVSNVNLHRNNLYCTLKDNYSQISLLLFNCKTLSLKEGDNVLAEGQVSYYVKTGKVTFVAKEIEIYGGAGKQYEKFLLLKDDLEKKGYFKEEHKIKPPILPLNVCVLTSKAGSVIEDIYSTIRKNNAYINLSIYDVAVQGQFAVRDIVQGLKQVDSLSYDAIILARGGGSFEDLEAFNSESVVKQIFDTKTFIISAIGHETDFTLSDAVADVRCLTPTAAATYIVNQFNLTIQKVGESLSQIMMSVERKLDSVKNQIFSYLNEIRYGLDVKLLKMESFIKQTLTRIELQNPKMILEKGYFRIQFNEKDCMSIAELSQNDVIEILGQDGRATAIISKIFLKKEEKE